MNPEYQRVLFIAPENTGLPRLDVAPEVDTLSALGYEVIPLQGYVVTERIFALATTSRVKADIIHFAGHVTPDGDQLVLSEGALDIDSVLNLVRAVGAKLVHINGCAAPRFGAMLIERNVPAVIATLIKIEDRQAKQIAQAYYLHLAETGDPHRAFVASQPSTPGVRVWLTNGRWKEILIEPVTTAINELRKMLLSNEQEHVEMQRSIARLNEDCGSQHEQRLWFVRVSVGAIAVSTFITFIISLVLR